MNESSYGRFHRASHLVQAIFDEWHYITVKNTKWRHLCIRACMFYVQVVEKRMLCTAFRGWCHVCKKHVKNLQSDKISTNVMDLENKKVIVETHPHRMHESVLSILTQDSSSERVNQNNSDRRVHFRFPEDLETSISNEISEKTHTTRKMGNQDQLLSQGHFFEITSTKNIRKQLALNEPPELSKKDQLASKLKSQLRQIRHSRNKVPENESGSKHGSKSLYVHWNSNLDIPTSEIPAYITLAKRILESWSRVVMNRNRTKCLREQAIDFHQFHLKLHSFYQWKQIPLQHY